MRLNDRLVLLLAVSLALHALLLAFVPEGGEWVEAIYARGIYPVVGPIVAFLPGLLPVSLTVVLILALPALALAGLIRTGLRWRRGELRLRETCEATLAVTIVVLALVFHGFYLFWGYNYLRPPLEQRLALVPSGGSAADSDEFARRMIEAAVAARVDAPPWDRAELDALVDEAIAAAVVELEGRPTPVVSPLKGDLGFLAWQGTRGVISPLTLEAHVDFGLPPLTLAFSAAHEKAHLAGFARERDANFIAWYALTRAADPRLRYAAQLGVIWYFLNDATRPLAAPLEPDLQMLAAYDAEHVSRRIQRASLEVYGVYLRANRMSAGVADYGQVGQLIEAWVEQRGWPR